jgi:apolipoprotein N-acyltransferase
VVQAASGRRPRATAFLLGAAVAAGQAPLGAWWLALPALSLLVGLVSRGNLRARRLWLGFAGGAGYGAAALFWIVEPFLVDPWTHGWMAPFALALMAAGMGAFWAIAALAGELGRGPSQRAAALALGLGLSDLLRSYVLTGFPWALLGHIWSGTPLLLAASWTGPVGLSLATAAAAALPWAVIPRTRLRALVAVPAVLAIAAVWIWGAARLAQPSTGTGPLVTVRLVQPNAAQHLKWRDDMWRLFLDRQMDLTAAPAAARPDLVVWPETAVPFLLEDSGDFLRELSRVSGGVPVVFGIQRTEGPRYFNSLAAIDGAGKVTQVYDKWHLVPFGEYLPLGDALARFGISAFAAQAGNGYSAGPGARVLDLGPAGRVLPLICYEAIFPQDIRAAGERPGWLLQITNDSWFGDLTGPFQHLAQARFRAVEQGLPLVRVANTGVSAVIDPLGRLTAEIGLNEEGFLDAAIPAAHAATFYSRHGEFPVLAVIVVALATIGLAGRIRSG